MEEHVYAVEVLKFKCKEKILQATRTRSFQKQKNYTSTRLLINNIENQKTMRENVQVPGREFQTKNSICSQDTIYLSKQRKYIFRHVMIQREDKKKIWVRLIFCYDIIIENVGINITIRNRTVTSSTVRK